MPSSYRDKRLLASKKSKDRQISKVKVALVYDWITTPYGGAEQVLKAIKDIFPEAPLYTSIYDSSQAPWAKRWIVRSSFLQSWPFAKSWYRYYNLLMPLAFESLDLSRYDLVISVTSAFSKSVITKPNQLHICYLLTPPRWLWSGKQLESDKQPGFGKQPKSGKQPESNKASASSLMSSKLWQLPPLSWILNSAISYLRWADQASSTRPDYYLPISKLVADRWKKLYAQTCHHNQLQEVVYPPVPETPRPTPVPEISKSALGSTADKTLKFALIVSRLVGYKRFDLAIKACLRTKTMLVVAGDGPESKKLQEQARESIYYPHLESTGKKSLEKIIRQAKHQGKLIVWLGSITNGEKHWLYRHCRGLLLPGVEDFGISVLEANLYGKPAIVATQSGVSEVLKNNKQAVFIDKPTVKAVSQGLIKIKTKNWSPQAIADNARQFSQPHFQKKFKSAITKLWNKHQTKKT